MSRASDIIEFVETFCRVPEGAMVRDPIRLLEFQKRFIRDIYDNPHGTKRAFLSLARKNGKTALIACLVLAHLLAEGVAQQNSQIVVGALSRDQASILLNLVVKMIRLNPALEAVTRIKESTKEVIGLARNVQFKALAAEGKTNHGLSPVLAILDEVGQVKGPSSEFIDAIVTSQGAHESPLLIAISTQAAEDGDLFSIWLDDAEKSGDPRIVSHVYAAPKECALDDPEAWKAANPALGVFRSLPDVEQQAAEAKRMPSAENTFRNLVLNQRVATAAPFMSRSVWASCGEPATALEGMEVFAGLDLSKVSDLSAFVLIGHDSAGTWHVHPTFWTPSKGLIDRARRDRQPYDVWHAAGYLRTTPGATVDYSIVARDIAELTEGLDVRGIAFDRWRILELKSEFDKLGLTLPLIEHGQGYKDMSPALDSFEAEALNGRIRHGMHPVLTMCAAGAVVTRDPAGNRKLDKNKATSRIDGMVAAAMAFGLASKSIEAVREPDYQIYFL